MNQAQTKLVIGLLRYSYLKLD